MPALLHGPGYNLGVVGMPHSCALLGRFAIGGGLCYYGNITRTRNVNEYMLVLAACLVNVVLLSASAVAIKPALPLTVSFH